MITYTREHSGGPEHRYHVGHRLLPTRASHYSNRHTDDLRRLIYGQVTDVSGEPCVLCGVVQSEHGERYEAIYGRHGWMYGCRYLDRFMEQIQERRRERSSHRASGGRHTEVPPHGDSDNAAIAGDNDVLPHARVLKLYRPSRIAYLHSVQSEGRTNPLREACLVCNSLYGHHAVTEDKKPLCPRDVSETDVCLMCGDLWRSHRVCIDGPGGKNELLCPRDEPGERGESLNYRYPWVLRADENKRAAAALTRDTETRSRVGGLVTQIAPDVFIAPSGASIERMERIIGESFGENHHVAQPSPWTWPAEVTVDQVNDSLSVAVSPGHVAEEVMRRIARGLAHWVENEDEGTV